MGYDYPPLQIRLGYNCEQCTGAPPSAGRKLVTSKSNGDMLPPNWQVWAIECAVTAVIVCQIVNVDEFRWIPSF